MFPFPQLFRTSKALKERGLVARTLGLILLLCYQPSCGGADEASRIRTSCYMTSLPGAGPVGGGPNDQVMTITIAVHFKRDQTGSVFDYAVDGNGKRYTRFGLESILPCFAKEQYPSNRYDSTRPLLRIPLLILLFISLFAVIYPEEIIKHKKHINQRLHSWVAEWRRK